MATAQTPGPHPIEKATDPTPKAVLPLPPKDVGSEKYWREEIRKSNARRKKELTVWRANLDRYRGKPTRLPSIAPGEAIHVNVEFYNTEQKKAQLFFQRPDVMVTPKEGQDPELAHKFQQALNYFLGKDEIDVETLMDQLLMDVLCPAGFAGTKIGFEEVQVQVQMPTGAVDPLTGQPAVDPATGQPAMQAVPRRIHARWFWDRISPTRLLIPAGWTSVDYERAPWLGFRFKLDTDRMSRTFKMAAESLQDGPDADTLISDHDKLYQDDGAWGTEIWYRASLYDPTVKNPEQFRRIVLVETKKGEASVKIHENSPYQKFDAAGAFVGGMRGNPIHILTLRSMTDSAYVPSDCAVSLAASNELSLGRSQMIVQRKRNLPMRAVNTSIIGKKEVQKLERAEIQGIMPINGDPDQAIKVIASATLPRENFTFNDVIQGDIDRLWALGANQTAVMSKRGVTATESGIIQRATDNRLVKERNRVMHWYVQGAEKVSALLQMFATEDVLIPLVGQDGMKTFAAWSATGIDGRFAFEIKPDSGIRVDADEDRERTLRFYNLVARDPHINRIELLNQIVVKFGYDPARIVIRDLPPPPPERPKPSINIRAEDLGNPLVIALLHQYGIDIAEPTAAALLGQTPTMQPTGPPSGVQPDGRVLQSAPHPGSAQKTRPIDKHAQDRTGGRTGPRVQ